ncbi:MAG: hypothetical protein ACK4ND_00820 [Cytophagaceae bacterium]
MCFKNGIGIILIWLLLNPISLKAQVAIEYGGNVNYYNSKINDYHFRFRQGGASEYEYPFVQNFNPNDPRLAPYSHRHFLLILKIAFGIQFG